jgi:signal peptidase I
MLINRMRAYIAGVWKEWRLTIFIIVFVILPIKSVLADWNWVPSGSMNPTILEGDLVYVNKAAYDLRVPMTSYRVAHWGDPQRGDIVICFSPEDNIRLVKRVVAVGGDTVELRNDRLYLNGEALSYTPTRNDEIANLPKNFGDKCLFAKEDLSGIWHPVMINPQIRAMRNFGPVKIPDGSYFVMGDNRDNSKDSRYFGFVERKAIVGKAKGIIVSFDIMDKYEPRLKRFFAPLK